MTENIEKQDAPHEEDHASQKRWYILQVRPSCEKKVKELIENKGLQNTKGITDEIDQVMVPVQNVKLPGGKVREEISFRGYVFVKAKLTDEVWTFLKQLDGVQSFPGGVESRQRNEAKKPVPMTDEEAMATLAEVEKKKATTTTKFTHKVGDKVKISEGPFANFSGIVSHVDEDAEHVSVEVLVFGRLTPVKGLPFKNVEKDEEEDSFKN